MTDWLAGFVDRHPGWSLLWAMFLMFPLILIKESVVGMAHSLISRLLPPSKKDKP
jgi:hypothetical protein